MLFRGLGHGRQFPHRLRNLAQVVRQTFSLSQTLMERLKRSHRSTFDIEIEKMSTWYRFHLEETIKAMATLDGRRFFVHVREPEGQNRNPLEFYRWHLKEAQEAADRVVQLYYPHECDDQTCGLWRKSDS